MPSDPKDERYQITARVPIELRDRLAHASIDKRMTQTEIITEAVTEWLDRHHF
jgi:hypothetical protein